MLNVEKKIENGALFLTLEGQLDTMTSPGFNAELEPLLGEAASVTMDMKDIDYISSAGLRVLLAAEQVMEDKGAEKIRILNANKTILEIFNITGFVDLLSIE